MGGWVFDGSFQVLAAAAAGAELRLVGAPPAPGAAPQGPPVEAKGALGSHRKPLANSMLAQAEVGVDSLAIQRLRVLEDVLFVREGRRICTTRKDLESNAMRAEQLQCGWLGAAAWMVHFQHR